MPEEIEIPTEHLHEQIEEGAEEKRERWTLFLALSTAFMAVLAAFAGLLAGHHANEALVERMKASDQWNFYQAKNLKQEIAVNTDMILQAVGAAKPGQTAAKSTAASPAAASPASDHSKDIARYEKEKAEIKKQAEEDEAVSEAHLAKHVPLARAVTAFQIAIAISAIAVLTRRKPLWYGGLALTAVGVFFLIVGILP
jgi:lipopolysaccharide export LptBFGC system permease protein LptF